MSADPKQTASDLTPEQAHDYLLRNVKFAEFFDRLAQRGWPVRTEKEAAYVLHVAEQLAVAEELAHTKQAADATSFYGEAAGRLDAVLQPYLGQPADTRGVKQAGQYLNDPSIVRAAIVLQEAALANS